MRSNLDIRKESFGEAFNPSLVDRFGVWLSGFQIRKWIPSFKGLKIGDFGCGYHASFTRSILSEISQALLIDVAISKDLKENPRIQSIQGSLPDSLRQVPDQSLNVIICMSVLEHLWNPQQAIQEFRRILTPGGICLLNVPSWRGKFFLEYSAFRLHLSPASEMDDHKNYYDVKDLWPLLVQSGFKPSLIHCFKHKFGLNTFAICKREL